LSGFTDKERAIVKAIYGLPYEKYKNAIKSLEGLYKGSINNDRLYDLIVFVRKDDIRTSLERIWKEKKSIQKSLKNYGKAIAGSEDLKLVI